MTYEPQPLQPHSVARKFCPAAVEMVQQCEKIQLTPVFRTFGIVLGALVGETERVEADVNKRQVMASVGAAALIAGALFVAPASGATERSQRATPRAAATARIGATFTPAAADPRLAAIFARSGLDDNGFRFTPAQTRSGGRAITVAVRARTNRTADTRAIAAVEPAPAVGLAPIAYNLGVAVGWKRFAVQGDVKRVDAGIQPGSREAFDLGVSYTGKRFGAQVKAAADRPLDGAPRMIEGVPSYSVDVGGSYRLTRNLDVTAGVRYRTDRERLARMADDRRDSQAVYLGTAFRF